MWLGGTISSCRPERKSIGTSVMEGRKVSEAQTWWQRRVRYLAGGMIDGINFLMLRNVFSNTNPTNLLSF